MAAIIDSSHVTSELFQETCSYSVYRKDRNLRGEGVMLLVHKITEHMPSCNLITTQSHFGQKCL